MCTQKDPLRVCYFSGKIVKHASKNGNIYAGSRKKRKKLEITEVKSVQKQDFINHLTKFVNKDMFLKGVILACDSYSA